MNDLLLKIVIMSVKAGVIAAVALFLRLLLLRAPKQILPVMWGTVGLRLFLPYNIPLKAVNIPEADFFRQKVIQEMFIPVQTAGTTVQTSTESHTGPHADLFSVLAVVWLAGVTIMLLYMVISHIVLYGRLKYAVRLRDNIYMSEYVTSPFVIGIIRPRIYISYNAGKKDLENIIAHELTHIKRFDHIIKPMAFILLSVHWFNPLIWIAYIMFCGDIELACDEKTVSGMDLSAREDYAQTLLNYSRKGNSTVKMYTLTYGGGGMKKRILSVLNYHRSSAVITAISVAAVIILAAVSLTAPGAANKATDYPVETVLEPITDSADSDEDVSEECVVLADFDYDDLAENEYICRVNDVVFKIRIADDSMCYTFYPNIAYRDMRLVSEGITEGLDKAYRDMRAGKTYSSREEAIAAPHVSNEEVFWKFWNSVIIKR